MICGALQTLNEEACEDVLEEAEEAHLSNELDLPVTSVIPPSPDTNQGECHKLPSSSGMTRSCMSGVHVEKSKQKKVTYESNKLDGDLFVLHTNSNSSRGLDSSISLDIE